MVGRMAFHWSTGSFVIRASNLSSSAIFPSFRQPWSNNRSYAPCSSVERCIVSARYDPMYKGIQMSGFSFATIASSVSVGVYVHQNFTVTTAAVVHEIHAAGVHEIVAKTHSAKDEECERKPLFAASML